MTPAERVVVAAAVRWHENPNGERAPDLDKMLDAAVQALLAERADPAAPTDSTMRWADVVEGDEIYSDNTRWWYAVMSSGPLAGTPRVRVVAKGLPKAIEPAAAAPVRVRRGPTGLAVDMFATVLWSGTSGPIVPESETGPVLEPDTAHDPEASEPPPVESEDE